MCERLGLPIHTWESLAYGPGVGMKGVSRIVKGNEVQRGAKRTKDRPEEIPPLQGNKGEARSCSVATSRGKAISSRDQSMGSILWKVVSDLRRLRE